MLWLADADTHRVTQFWSWYLVSHYALKWCLRRHRERNKTWNIGGCLGILYRQSAFGWRKLAAFKFSRDWLGTFHVRMFKSISKMHLKFTELKIILIIVFLWIKNIKLMWGSGPFWSTSVKNQAVPKIFYFISCPFLSFHKRALKQSIRSYIVTWSTYTTLFLFFLQLVLETKIWICGCPIPFISGPFLRTRDFLNVI